MNKSSLLTTGVLVAVAIIAVVAFSRSSQPAQALDGFARCLTQKGAVMYGASWCSHCQNEKRAFGDAFKYVAYVECTEDPKVCTDAGVRGYPTWKFPDGRKLEGEQGISGLSQATGCAVPGSE